MKKTLPDKYVPGFLRNEMDKRTSIAKRLNEVYQEVVDDCGGSENITRTKRTLIERFVFLSALVAKYEVKIATNPKRYATKLVPRVINSTNTLMGLAKILGLNKVRNKKDLRSYLEEREHN